MEFNFDALEKKGLKLNPAPAPVGSYVQCIRTGNYLHLSGGISINGDVAIYGKLGAEVIGRLLQLRDELNGPEVLIGAGVSAKVISTILVQLPHARAFHMSGKTEIESGMRFRREGVPMGLPGLDEWHIQQTDVNAVRAARDALNGWDPTGGCTYYYNPATATSAWIWSREVRLTIGAHAFAV